MFIDPSIPPHAASLSDDGGGDAVSFVHDDVHHSHGRRQRRSGDDVDGAGAVAAARKEVQFQDHAYGVPPIPSFDRLRAQQEARRLELRLAEDTTPKVRNRHRHDEATTSGSVSTKSRATTAGRSSQTNSSKQAVVGDYDGGVVVVDDRYDGDAEDDGRSRRRRFSSGLAPRSSPKKSSFRRDRDDNDRDDDGDDGDEDVEWAAASRGGGEHRRHPVNLNFKRSRSAGAAVPVDDVDDLGNDGGIVVVGDKIPPWLSGRFLVGLLVFSACVAVAAALGWQTERRGEALLAKMDHDAVDKTKEGKGDEYYYGDETKKDGDDAFSVVDAAVAATPYRWAQVGEPLPHHGAYGDESSSTSHAWFGYDASLSADGTVLAVGVPRSPSDGGAGAARVYGLKRYLDPVAGDFRERWSRLGDGDLTARNSTGGDRFGWSVSTSSDGRVVAVGAVRGDDGQHGGHNNNKKKNAVEVFEHDAFLNEWERAGENLLSYDASDSDDDDRAFGYAVAVAARGDRVVVGGPGRGDRPGAVRVLDRDRASGVWTRAGSDLVGTDPAFGRAVAVSRDGDRIVVGSVGVDDDRGAARAYEFRRVDGDRWDWAPMGDLVAPRDDDDDVGRRNPGDRAGFSVSLSADGEKLAVGVVGHDDGARRDVGRVDVYRWDSAANEWTPLGRSVVGDADGGRIGFSVRLSADGRRLAVGGAAGNSVRVYEHLRNGDDVADRWVRVGRDVRGRRPGDFAGFAVALSASGNRVAVGAPMNDDRGENGGQVRVFDLKERP